MTFAARTLLQRAYYSSAGTILSRGFAALTGIVIAGAAGPAEFGIYAAVWSVMGLCFSLADVGIVTGLKREGAREPGRIPELLGNALLIKIAALAPALGAAWLLQSVFVQSPLALTLFVPLAAANFAMTGAEPCFAVLQLRGEQRDAALVMVLRGGIIFAGVCVIAGRGGGVAAMAWCQAVVSLGTAVAVLLLVLRRVSIAFALARMRRQIRRAVAFGASELVYSAFQNAPILFLARFGTEVETGYFALVQRFTSLCVVAGTTANSQAFLPALFGLYHEDRPRYAQVCAHMQRLFTAAGVTLAAALYACSEPVLALIRESYRPAAPIMQWLCWSVLLAYAAIAADAALSAGDRMRVKVAIQTIATLVVVLLSVALAGSFGARGVAAAVLCGTAVALAGMGGYVWRKRLYPLRGAVSLGIGGSLLVLCALVTAPIAAARPLTGSALFCAGAAAVWLTCFRGVFAPGDD